MYAPCGYLRRMEYRISMDAAGSIVIPAAVRRELALSAGSELAVEVRDGVIHLRPITSARLERRAGRLVIASPLAGPAPDHRDLREERLARLGPKE